jgi:hypothetical protein
MLVAANRLSADDRLDIMDLVARYAHTLDSGDLDTCVKLDGRWYFRIRRLRPLAGRIPGREPAQ